MGIMVVYFNVSGYDILFNDSKLLGIASPFSILVALAEFAVLCWTYSVISNWPNVSRLLKSMIFLLVPMFSFLCFSGINSYLTTLANEELREFEKVKIINSNNEVFIRTKEKEIEIFESSLKNLNKNKVLLTSDIKKVNDAVNQIEHQSSERRKIVRDCTQVPDCVAAINGFEQQKSNLQHEIDLLNADRNSVQSKITNTELAIQNAQAEIEALKKKGVSDINAHAGTESNHAMKKESYERIIIQIASVFGIVPQDPFGVFINIISFLVYPVYFILNLYLALGSEQNKLARVKRREFERKRKPIRENLMNKTVKYFRVWACRRTKTKVTEVEKIVEIEKVVEKEIPVKVDKIVQVKHEIPVYVDKITKVPEPYLIKDPQVVVLEKIVPIQDGLTKEELENAVQKR